MKYIKLFEDFSNSNIYTNKHGIVTIDNYIIPDAVEVLSENPNALKFNSKEEFKRYAATQKYFSASEAWCFYDMAEKQKYHETKELSEESKNSSMLFETGHEIVQVWDEKNQIGYILPDSKTHGQLKINK